MEDNNKKTIGYLIGQFVGTVLIGCVGVCISGVAISMTIKFLSRIF